MGAAYFYHLTDSLAEEVLRMLLPRARDQGWRVEVRGRDQDRMVALDAALWDGPGEAFLPHGLAGGSQDALQPVLLTTAQAAGCDCVMAIDGAEVTAAEAAALQRLCILFDGTDPAAVAQARAQWKALASAAIPAQYWAQDDGRWTKKAES